MAKTTVVCLVWSQVCLLFWRSRKDAGIIPRQGTCLDRCTELRWG